MQVHTTIRSPGAILLAFVFFCVTAYVLFQDVWKGGLGVIGPDHVMTMAVLIGTIAAGHWFWSEASQWRVFPAIGLAILFCAGTVYCVISSAGRNAVATIEKGLDAHKINDDRATLKADIATAQARFEEAYAAEKAADACGGAEGPICKSRRKTREERETHLNVLKLQLKAMKGEQPEGADLKYAAKVIATLPGVTSAPEQIAEALGLLMPFFKAAFSEIATIVFAAIGVGHRLAPRIDPRWQPSPAESRQTSFPPIDPTPTQPSPVPPGNRRRRVQPSSKSTATVVAFPGNRRQGGVSETGARAWLLAHIQRNGCLPSQDTMAGELQVHKGTVAKWMRKWEAEGVIVRDQAGRCKTVRMA